MTNVSEWAVAAGSNNSAPPDGAPENMLPGKVNDCMREIMAALARWYKDQNASLTTTGTGAAFTLTTNCVYTALNDIALLVFRAHTVNTGASCTLNVDGLGAKPLRKSGNLGDYAAGELVSGQTVVVAYNSGTDDFEVIGPAIANPPALTAAAGLALLLTVDGAGSGLDADLLDGNSSAAFAKIANNLSDLASAATAFSNIKQAASDTATGAVELAVQSEMETGTDVVRAVVPGRMQHHPGVAKAWVKWDVTGSINASYNVSSVTDNGNGDWTINFTVPFSSTSYVCIGTVQTAAGDGRQFNVDSANAPTVSACRVLSVNALGDDAADPAGAAPRMHAVFYGDQ